MPSTEDQPKASGSGLKRKARKIVASLDPDFTWQSAGIPEKKAKSEEVDTSGKSLAMKYKYGEENKGMSIQFITLL